MPEGGPVLIVVQDIGNRRVDELRTKAIYRAGLDLPDVFTLLAEIKRLRLMLLRVGQEQVRQRPDLKP